MNFEPVTLNNVIGKYKPQQQEVENTEKWDVANAILYSMYRYIRYMQEHQFLAPV